MNSANRVISNTTFIYLSMLVKILIGFFSVRLILQALGQEDYGISGVVGGVVATLDILSLNMTNTSMRFLSHSLGEGCMEKMKRVFNTTIYLHYIIAFITFFILEIGGWLMFKYVLDIPEARLTVAHIIYQFSVVTALISIVAVPYDAVMNAHEHLWVISFYNILSSIFALIFAITMFYIPWDRLIFWGISNFLVQLVLRILKVRYSKRHFEECRVVNLRSVTKADIRPMISFTGWAMFGNLSSMAVTQLRGIILNSFFGVRLNASENVAKSVTNYINQFSMALTKAINPQIMKSEGGGNHDRMIRIVEIGSKYSSFLFSFIGIPVLLNASFIFNLWLKEVPDYAVIFSQLIIVELLVDKFSNQINAAIYAVGNIKVFQVIESTIGLSFVPIIFILFKLGASPEYLYLTILFITLVKYIDRFYFGKKNANINLAHYVKSAILPIAIPLFVSIAFTMIPFFLIDDGFIKFVLITMFFCSVYVCTFFFGLTPEEKVMIKNLINGVRSKWMINKH